MSEKFGLVTWEEEVGSKSNSNHKRDEFMRVQPGNNRVRLLTRAFQYWVHKWKEEGDKGFGEKVYCSKFHGTCPLCDKGDKPKKRWFVGVADRTSGTYKVLDMGAAIYQHIQTYSRDNDWGDPTTYDVDIVVDRNGGATGYYKIVPKPKTSLTDADVSMKQGVDLDDLKRRCTPPTAEEVGKRLERIRSRKNASKNEADTSTDDDSDDSLFSFPPADQQSVRA